MEYEQGKKKFSIKQKNLRTDIYDLVRAFSGQANQIVINTKVLEYCNSSYETAALLSQIIYWSDKTNNKQGWIAKTYPEWHEELFLSEYSVRKAIKFLSENAGVETKVMRFAGNPTVHYRIDIEKFSDSFLKFLKERTFEDSRNQPEETSDSYTDTTTDTTNKENIRGGIKPTPPPK